MASLRASYAAPPSRRECRYPLFPRISNVEVRPPFFPLKCTNPYKPISSCNPSQRQRPPSHTVANRGAHLTECCTRGTEPGVKGQRNNWQYHSQDGGLRQVVCWPGLPPLPLPASSDCTEKPSPGPVIGQTSSLAYAKTFGCRPSQQHHYRIWPCSTANAGVLTA